jgi:hypothetical protein
MKQSLDATEFMSSVAMMARKAETYPPETPVIDLEELQRIIWQMAEPKKVAAKQRGQP